MRPLLVGCCAGLLASSLWLVGCLSPEEQCAEVATENECLQADGCAWGTDERGPHCFYVGDVELQ